jgi:hypothetical protein
MIASFTHGFVFIKTRKTAGTSIEISLSMACGPDDIVTPISFEDEVLRTKLAGNVLPRNYAAQQRIEEEYAAGIQNGVDTRKEIPGWGRNRFWNHMPASAVANCLKDEFWRSAFKFTIERHPYEKVVSAAFHRLARRGRPISDLPIFIDKVATSLETDEDLYMTDGTVVVDEVIRHETLKDDLRRIAHNLKIEMPSLPNAKASFRKDRRPAREILSDRQKQIIQERHRSVFARMGYEP